LLAGLSLLCASASPAVPLFAALGSRDNLVDPALQLVRSSLTLPGMVHADGVEHYTSHCLRVGTCTALNKLGLRKEQIELWVGWASRDMFAHYVRQPVFLDSEVSFISQLFS
jgi:hypothetical protein